ncbi:MAG TPA: hypothetical protein VF517_14595 [Thermoleophilaceae bacterium]|jgi:hypothetical protein
MRRLGAAASVALVAAAPYVIFRSTFEDAATDFRWELVYLISGWGPFVLMGIGVLWFVPVVLSMHRTGYSRLYLRPVTRHACEAWGLVTYTLGFMLAIQTSQIAGLF